MCSSLLDAMSCCPSQLIEGQAPELLFTKCLGADEAISMAPVAARPLCEALQADCQRGARQRGVCVPQLLPGGFVQLRFSRLQQTAPGKTNLERSSSRRSFNKSKACLMKLHLSRLELTAPSRYALHRLNRPQAER